MSEKYMGAMEALVQRHPYLRQVHSPSRIKPALDQHLHGPNDAVNASNRDALANAWNQSRPPHQGYPQYSTKDYAAVLENQLEEYLQSRVRRSRSARESTNSGAASSSGQHPDPEGEAANKEQQARIKQQTRSAAARGAAGAASSSAAADDAAGSTSATRPTDDEAGDSAADVAALSTDDEAANTEPPPRKWLSCFNCLR